MRAATGSATRTTDLLSRLSSIVVARIGRTEQASSVDEDQNVKIKMSDTLVRVEVFL